MVKLTEKEYAGLLAQCMASLLAKFVGEIDRTQLDIARNEAIAILDAAGVVPPTDWAPNRIP